MLALLMGLHVVEGLAQVVGCSRVGGGGRRGLVPVTGGIWVHRRRRREGHLGIAHGRRGAKRMRRLVVATLGVM
jgi:hypothetical protein